MKVRGQLLKTGLLLSATLLFFASAIAEETALSVGDTAPDVLGKNRKGDEIKVSDNLGKIVVANFWDTKCKKCSSQLQLLENLQQMAGKKLIEVVSILYKQKRHVFVTAVKSFGDIQMTMAVDARGHAGKAYGVDKLPHMVIINKEGKVAYIHAGHDKKIASKLENEINTLLAQ